MFGTNDLGELQLKEYEQKTAEVVERCLKNGTVVLLTTLPPRSGLLEKSKQFAEAVRRVARDEAGAADRLPRRDPQAPARRLGRGAAEVQGRAGQRVRGADADRPRRRPPVQPAGPPRFSAESLSRNGYVLRNYLTLLAYAEVVQRYWKIASKCEYVGTNGFRASRLSTRAPVPWWDAAEAACPSQGRYSRKIVSRSPEEKAIRHVMTSVPMFSRLCRTLAGMRIVSPGLSSSIWPS